MRDSYHQQPQMMFVILAGENNAHHWLEVKSCYWNVLYTERELELGLIQSEFLNFSNLKNIHHLLSNFDSYIQEKCCTAVVKSSAATAGSGGQNTIEYCSEKMGFWLDLF